MSKEPASKETIKGLYENMGNNFLLYVPLICSYVDTIESLEKINVAEAKSEPEVVMLNFWQILFRLQVFTLIANLDLSTLLRANFRTESAPEKRCNLKYINVITLEGYKYLFGYGSDEKNGIWTKFKVLAVQINDNELKSDINNFEIFIEEFKGQYTLSDDRDSRNLSVHYDQEPLKVYENLEKIGEDDEVKRTGAFLKVLDRMSVFIGKYVQKYNVPIVCRKNNYNFSLREEINISPDKDNKLFHALGNNIISFSARLNNIVSTCRKPELIKKSLNLDDLFLEELQPLINTISPGIHIHFIYSDLASAIRAYLSSEHYFEKQMNLRRINIIVYEGFKHIYGYTNDDQSRSFWYKYIYLILANSIDQNLKNSLSQIELKLNELATNTNVNNERLREYSVHYRHKDRDNIIPLFHTLLESNPLAKMNKALILIEILPKLIELNTESINVVYNIKNAKIQLSNKGTIEKLDNMLAFIKNSPASPKQKKSFIEIMDKIKNMLLS